MARQARVAPAGTIYHVMNRTAGKFVMLRRDKDFLAFQRILIEAHERESLPILAYCLMGTHWHFVVHQEKKGQMARFFRWLTLTHAVRWRVAHNSVEEWNGDVNSFDSAPRCCMLSHHGKTGTRSTRRDDLPRHEPHGREVRHAAA